MKRVSREDMKMSGWEPSLFLFSHISFFVSSYFIFSLKYSFIVSHILFSYFWVVCFYLLKVFMG